MKTNRIATALSIVSAFIFLSCKKDTTVPLQIMLTDKPASYDEVNVNIVGLRVNMSKDTSGWIDVPVNAGVYNLLTLQNGVSTELAKGDVPQGRLKDVRFVLGDGSTVKVNGTTYPLATPSAEQSGLKISIEKDLGETMNTFTLDFDASLSIKEENGSYKLDPVIRIK